MRIRSLVRSATRNAVDEFVRVLMRTDTIRGRVNAFERRELQLRMSVGSTDPMRKKLGVPNENGAFQVDNYPISKFLVEELLPLVGHWPYPPPEVHLMVAAVCWVRPNLIIEWGTNVGNSACIFWHALKKFDIPCHTHSIDLPADVQHPENVKSRRGHLVKDLPGISLYLGDGLEVALRIFRDRPVGARCLFFVDGDHAYESVTRELEGIMDGAPDAAILLHDTLSSLKRWPHEALQDALKSRPGAYRVVSTDIGLPGMSFVYPRGMGNLYYPQK